MRKKLLIIICIPFVLFIGLISFAIIKLLLIPSSSEYAAIQSTQQQEVKKEEDLKNIYDVLNYGSGIASGLRYEFNHDDSSYDFTRSYAFINDGVLWIIENSEKVADSDSDDSRFSRTITFYGNGESKEYTFMWDSKESIDDVLPAVEGLTRHYGDIWKLSSENQNVAKLVQEYNETYNEPFDQTNVGDSIGGEWTGLQRSNRFAEYVYNDYQHIIRESKRIMLDSALLSNSEIHDMFSNINNQNDLTQTIIDLDYLQDKTVSDLKREATNHMKNSIFIGFDSETESSLSIYEDNTFNAFQDSASRYKYEGESINGEPYGYGIAYHAGEKHKQRYEGFYIDGIRSEYGKFHESGKFDDSFMFEFEGTFDYGAVFTYGTMDLGNGNWYEGEFPGAGLYCFNGVTKPGIVIKNDAGWYFEWQ